MDLEVWVEIEAGAYLLSNLGRLKTIEYSAPLRQSHHRLTMRRYPERFLKAWKSRGTWLYCLSRNPPAKKIAIYLAVARNFLDNPECLRHVGFKDGNENNYQVSNLYWY